MTNGLNDGTDAQIVFVVASFEEVTSTNPLPLLCMTRAAAKSGSLSELSVKQTVTGLV